MIVALDDLQMAAEGSSYSGRRSYTLPTFHGFSVDLRAAQGYRVQACAYAHISQGRRPWRVNA